MNITQELIDYIYILDSLEDYKKNNDINLFLYNAYKYLNNTNDFNKELFKKIKDFIDLIINKSITVFLDNIKFSSKNYLIFSSNKNEFIVNDNFSILPKKLIINLCYHFNHHFKFKE